MAQEKEMNTFDQREVGDEITVVTIDDHHLIREGISSILNKNSNIKVVGEGWDGASLERLVKQHQPDIVLLDLEMPSDATQPESPSFSAFPAIAKVRKQFPNTRIIIISQHATHGLIEGALSTGVNGYLLKDDALSLHLIDAIQAVYLNGVYFSGEVTRNLIEVQAMKKKTTVLTERQEEILRTIAANPDWSYANHAETLGISEHTFSNHLRQIFDRLEVNNVTAALIKAIQLGIVSVK